MRKAIELAKAGDVQMLKFLLDRILPKSAPCASTYPQWIMLPDLSCVWTISKKGSKKSYLSWITSSREGDEPKFTTTNLES